MINDSTYGTPAYTSSLDKTLLRCLVQEITGTSWDSINIYCIDIHERSLDYSLHGYEIHYGICSTYSTSQKCGHP